MSEFKDEVIDVWKNGEAINNFENGLEDLQEKAEEVVANPLAFKEWKVGDFCRVMYKGDGFYYEGVIKAMRKNVCTVEYIGYSESARFHRSKLLETFGEEARERQIEESEAFNYLYNYNYGEAVQRRERGRKSASKSHGYEEDLSEWGACAATPPSSEEETENADYNLRSRNGKKNRRARAPTPGACGCMPKIPIPQLPMECVEDPLIEAMLRSWFVSGYYAGKYAAGKNGGNAEERG